MTRESAVENARNDLASRLNVDVGSISEKSVSDKEFRDMSLGAAVDGEMAAQMIAYGWIIELESGGKTYEYRADKYQLRLHNFNGANHVVV